MSNRIELTEDMINDLSNQFKHLTEIGFFKDHPRLSCEENKDNPLLVNLIKAGTVNEIVLFFPKFIVDELLEKYRTTMGV